MTDEDWVPRGVDATTPNVARIYDFLLGGKDNFAADRAAAEELLQTRPDVAKMAKANRRFLVRVVRYLAEAGIRQFIDLGTGIPTAPSVHQVARDIQPDANVVYVDNDPVVAVHNNALLVTDDGVVALHGDIREPAKILEDPATTALIDFSQPVGILFLAVLHFVSDDEDPWGIVASFRDRIPSGSHVAISAATHEGLTTRETSDFHRSYREATSSATLRSRDQIAAFFDGFELVDPGLVTISSWRATGLRSPQPLGGVARKP